MNYSGDLTSLILFFDFLTPWSKKSPRQNISISTQTLIKIHKRSLRTRIRHVFESYKPFTYDIPYSGTEFGEGGRKRFIFKFSDVKSPEKFIYAINLSKNA